MKLATAVLSLCAVSFPGFAAAFRYEFFQMDSYDTVATGINNHGDVTGYCLCVPIGGPLFETRGFVRKADGTTEIFRVPDQVINIFPQGINDSGQIAGWYHPDAGATPRGFVRDADGTYRTFFEPTAVRQQTIFADINNKGEVGGYYQGTMNSILFVLNPSLSAYEDRYDAPPEGISELELGEDGILRDFKQPAGLRSDLWALGSNDRGQYTGYTMDFVNFGFIATPIPEPSAIAMTMFGLAAAAFLRKNR